jgi:hypothetical protein
LHSTDFEGARAARARASSAIDALPVEDPRYVEAHCRAGFAHHNMMNVGVADRHFRRAIEVLRRRGIADPEQRYATAARPAFSISLFFSFDPDKKLPRHVQLETTGIALDPDDCRTPDVALLELARASLYQSANRVQMREVGKPARTGLGTLAADTGAALQDEIEAALGPKHRLTLAMLEHMNVLCNEQQERKFPKRCPPLFDIRERTFAERGAALGGEHPDTRRSALFLGGHHLADGRVVEARRLFEQAGGGAQDDVWIAAHQLLAGLEFDEGNAREGFVRLQRVAAALPTAASDRYWGSLQAWRLHEEAALLTGHDEEAERARREQARIDAEYHYVGPGGPNLAMIAITLGADGAALHETAVSGVVVARTHELRRRDLAAAARGWRTAELDVALQCRALLRHRAGDGDGAAEDLRALATLRRG